MGRRGILQFQSPDLRLETLQKPRRGNTVQLGVVDLEKGAFIAFEREGYENLYEKSIGWSNDSTVSINATASDGETQYLIFYTF